MTPHERKVMAEFCRTVDCNKVQVHDGSGATKWENAARRAVLDNSEGNSVTMGYHIFIHDNHVGRDPSLAHEMTHVSVRAVGRRPLLCPRTCRARETEDG